MDATDHKPDAAPSLSAAAISALQHGRKIEAIKIVRAERNIGLKEAKEAVDDYVRSQPVIQSTLAAARSETTRSALLWIGALVVLAILAYYLLAQP